jgi:hypothetical protein
MHPGVQPREDVPDTQPPLQYVTPDIAPGASFTAWMNAPSTGGASGRRFVSMARYSPERQTMKVIFENTGKRWKEVAVPRGERGGLAAVQSSEPSWPMLLDQMRFGPGQPSRQFEKL